MAKINLPTKRVHIINGAYKGYKGYIVKRFNNRKLIQIELDANPHIKPLLEKKDVIFLDNFDKPLEHQPVKIYSSSGKESVSDKSNKPLDTDLQFTFEQLLNIKKEKLSQGDKRQIYYDIMEILSNLLHLDWTQDDILDNTNSLYNIVSSNLKEYDTENQQFIRKIIVAYFFIYFNFNHIYFNAKYHGCKKGDSNDPSELLCIAIKHNIIPKTVKLSELDNIIKILANALGVELNLDISLHKINLQEKLPSKEHIVVDPIEKYIVEKISKKIDDETNLDVIQLLTQIKSNLPEFSKNYGKIILKNKGLYGNNDIYKIITHYTSQYNTSKKLEQDVKKKLNRIHLHSKGINTSQKLNLIIDNVKQKTFELINHQIEDTTSQDKKEILQELKNNFDNYLQGKNLLDLINNFNSKKSRIILPIIRFYKLNLHNKIDTFKHIDTCELFAAKGNSIKILSALSHEPIDKIKNAVKSSVYTKTLELDLTTDKKRKLELEHDINIIKKCRNITQTQLKISKRKRSSPMDVDIDIPTKIEEEIISPRKNAKRVHPSEVKRLLKSKQPIFSKINTKYQRDEDKIIEEILTLMSKNISKKDFQNNLPPNKYLRISAETLINTINNPTYLQKNKLNLINKTSLPVLRKDIVKIIIRTPSEQVQHLPPDYQKIWFLYQELKNKNKF